MFQLPGLDRKNVSVCAQSTEPQEFTTEEVPFRPLHPYQLGKIAIQINSIFQLWVYNLTR